MPTVLGHEPGFDFGNTVFKGLTHWVPPQRFVQHLRSPLQFESEEHVNAQSEPTSFGIGQNPGLKSKNKYNLAECCFNWELGVYIFTLWID